MKEKRNYETLEEWLNVLETFIKLDADEYEKRSNIKFPIYNDFIYVKNYVEKKLNKEINKKLVHIINEHKISKISEFWSNYFNMVKVSLEMNSYLKLMYEKNIPYNDNEKLSKKLIQIENEAIKNNIQIAIIPYNAKDYLAFFKLISCEVYLNNDYLHKGKEEREKRKLKNKIIKDFIEAMVYDNYRNDKKFNADIRITDNNLKIYEKMINERNNSWNVQKTYYKKISSNEIEIFYEESKNKRTFFIH